MYELQIMDDGTVSQFYTYTNFDNEYAICRPSGTIRMLAVVVDYGNTGADPNEVVNELYQSLATANQRGQITLQALASHSPSSKWNLPPR